MFFSVVIPTYNPRQFLPELLSNIQQNDCKNDIEVIISDDCSTEPFNDVLEQYGDMNIKVITNDHHYGFPRVGRENGMNAASGQWIAFVDQDDIFVDYAFDSVKEVLIEKDLHNVLFCDFYIDDPNKEPRLAAVDGAYGWTHGKFYERDFLVRHQIHYDEVQYGEDTNFCAKVQCTLTEYGYIINHVHVPIYIWRRREGSLSNGNYLLMSMSDYVTGTLGVVVSYLEKHKPEDPCFEDFMFLCVADLLHIYFYTQHAMFLENKDVLMTVMLNTLQYVRRLEAYMNWTTADLINVIINKYFDTYNEIREIDNKQINFIEQKSFPDWMSTYF